MCGIFGSVFESGALDLDAALDRLNHRGPDARGVHRTGDIVLGHTRLSIIDLSEAARQPMTNGQITVVFNGEIYNHHELRKDLASRGRTFRTRSDTEVIVEGFSEHGPAFFERLDGMFAIGLVDHGARKLFLVRDRAGKKPLFYTIGEGVRFSSEIRALFASGVPIEIATESLPMLLALGYVPPPKTLYRNIQQLPPATILEFEAGRTPTLRTFWRAPFDAAPLDVDANEAKHHVRSLVEKAVLRRLEADVPLGAFLSGGIDSTIVVGVMARASTQRVKTFSIGFSGDPRFDETHFARIAAKAFDTQHTEYTLDPSAFDLLDRLVEAHDGPFGDSSAIPTSVVSMLTRKHVTVALTGDGGDELFAGYPRFLAAEAAERVPRAFRRVADSVAARIPIRERRAVRAKRLFRNAALELPDRMLRWQSYFVDDLGEILHSDLRERLSVDGVLEWSRDVAERTRGSSPLTRALQYNFDTYLPFDLLVKADRTSMLHGLELRAPFLDTALVDYAARLPDRLRRHFTTTKWILRRAFEDILPEAIMHRGKLGFGMPLGTWFRTTLRPFVRETLGPGAKINRFVDTARVSALLDAHERGDRDYEHPIWLLLTVERWLQLLPAWSGRTAT